MSVKIVNKYLKERVTECPILRDAFLVILLLKYALISQRCNFDSLLITRSVRGNVGVDRAPTLFNYLLTNTCRGVVGVPLISK